MIKEVPNIFLQLTLENVEENEENWLLKELSTLSPEDRKPAIKVTYNQDTDK